MFRLHDRTRRRIALAGFFAFCVVPTVLIAAWGTSRHLPWHLRAESRKLSRELGLNVSLAAIRHLRPGVVLYEGLQLTDPETGQGLFRCRLLEAGWRNPTGRQQHDRVSLVLIASQPEIEAAGLNELWQLLHRVFTRRAGSTEIDVRLVAGEVTLRADCDAQTFSDVQADIEWLADRTRAQLHFRLAGVEMPETARIRIDRNRQTTAPTTRFELYTGGAALPCPVLAAGLSGLKSLGPRGTFCGYLWAEQTLAGWEGEAAGHLNDIELDRLVTDRFPHKLGGTAQVTIRRARFRRGRFEEASGLVLAGPGTVSRSLLQASAERLGLTRIAEPGTPGPVVPYDRLAFAFSIDPRGLQLRGECLADGAPAVLVDRAGPLLGEPVSPRPVVALLRTLVPANEVQVPATRQTDWLARWLPLPNVAPPSDTDPPLPHARVRLGRDVRE